MDISLITKARSNHSLHACTSTECLYFDNINRQTESCCVESNTNNINIVQYVIMYGG